MTTNQAPMPVQLNPPGPYETPVVQAYLGVEFAREESPARFRVLLENGVELYLSMTGEAVKDIREALKQYPETPNWPRIG